MRDEPQRGRRLHLDPGAESADPNRPAFLARPYAKPVYYGFALTDVMLDGFTLGKISGFDEGDDYGDAFVVAPDGSRAGLVWEYAPAVARSELVEAVAPTADRWGVWSVRVPWPMSTREDQARNLAFMLPALRDRWRAWNERRHK